MQACNLVVVVFSCAACAAVLPRAPAPVGMPDDLTELERSFPHSVEVSADGPSPRVQFCPDNTCEAFISQGGASLEELSGFAHLFLYYFSDYGTLAAWRTGSAPRARSEALIAKLAPRECPPGAGREAARCVLRAMASARGIRVEAIRYDEGVRAAVPMALP